MRGLRGLNRRKRGSLSFRKEKKKLSKPVKILLCCLALLLLGGFIYLMKMPKNALREERKTLPILRILYRGKESISLPVRRKSSDEKLLEPEYPLADDLTLSYRFEGEIPPGMFYTLNSDEDGTLILMNDMTGEKEGKLVFANLLTKGKRYIFRVWTKNQENCYEALLYYEKTKNIQRFQEFAAEFSRAAVSRNDTNQMIARYIHPSSEVTFSRSYVTEKAGQELIFYGNLHLQPSPDCYYAWQNITEDQTEVRVYRDVKTGKQGMEKEQNVEERFRLRIRNDKIYLLSYERFLNWNTATRNRILSSVRQPKSFFIGTERQTPTFLQSPNGRYVLLGTDRELYLMDTKTGEAELLEAEESFGFQFRPLLVKDDGRAYAFRTGLQDKDPMTGYRGSALFGYRMGSNEKTLLLFSEVSPDDLYVSDDGNDLYFRRGNSLCLLESRIKEKVLLQDVLLPNEPLIFNGKSFFFRDTKGRVICYTKEEGEKVLPLPEGGAYYPVMMYGPDLVLEERGEPGVLASGYTGSGRKAIELRSADEKAVLHKRYEAGDAILTNLKIEDGILRIDKIVQGENGMRKERDSIFGAKVGDKKKDAVIRSYVTEGDGEKVYELRFPDGMLKFNFWRLKERLPLVSEERVKMIPIENEVKLPYIASPGGGILKAEAKILPAIQEVFPSYGQVFLRDGTLVWNRGARALKKKVALLPIAEKADTYPKALSIFLRQSGEKSDEESLRDYSKEGVMKLLASKEIKKTPLDLTGASAEELKYFLNKGVPIFYAYSASEYGMIVGYGQDTLTFLSLRTMAEQEFKTESLKERWSLEIPLLIVLNP